MRRHLATLLVFVLLCAPLAARSARLLPAQPFSGRAHFASHAEYESPIVCRRAGSLSIVAAVFASARLLTTACSAVFPHTDASTSIAGRAPRCGPRALLFARLHRKHPAPKRNDSADPPVAL